MDRLHRTRLLFGVDAISKLQSATVMVVGCGAVGSFAIEALARSGIGHLILIDFDKVEETNINRQLFALESTVDKLKVDVAKARIKDISPDITVEALNVFFDKDTELDVKPDFVIDAIDTVESKIALYKWCQEKGIPFISSMGAARKTDISQIKVDKISKTSVCPLAAKIRKIVKEKELSDFYTVFSTEPADDNVKGKIFGSIITVTGAFGLYLADFTIKHIINNHASAAI